MDRIANYRAVIGAMPMPALIISRTKRILTMNGAAKQVAGIQGAGGHYTTVLRQPTVIEAVEATLADNRPRQARLTTLSDARELTFQLDITPLDERPSPGILVVMIDSSGADSLGQMRRDFVANVSHELRTPLTALMGFIETLRGPAKNDAKASDTFLAMMETEAERMNRLVYDLLSLSRVESGERVRPDQAINIADVIREAVETLPQAADRHANAVSVDAPDDPVLIPGDRDQLIQVMRNLLENAFKYGAGRVEVKMSLLEREATLRGPAVVIDVVDDGEGIESHHVPRLTERFYRVDAHRSRAEGGTGLGLAIVKHIIGRHRGRLRISSVQGQGSVFTVILPRI